MSIRTIYINQWTVILDAADASRDLPRGQRVDSLVAALEATGTKLVPQKVLDATSDTVRQHILAAGKAK